MLRQIIENYQILRLYRKIRSAYGRYQVIEFMRINAQDETGKPEKIPTALKGCEAQYEAFCLACVDLRAVFPEDEQDQHIEELEELLKRDMETAYRG